MQHLHNTTILSWKPKGTRRTWKPKTATSSPVALLHVMVVPPCPASRAKAQVYRDPQRANVGASGLGCQVPPLQAHPTALRLWRCQLRMDCKAILATCHWPASTIVKPEPSATLLFLNCESICCLLSCSTACQLRWSKYSSFIWDQIREEGNVIQKSCGFDKSVETEKWQLINIRNFHEKTTGSSSNW